MQVLSVQHLAALLVDDLTLGVHHVVVLEHVFPGLEVPGLHLLLGVLNGPGQHFCVDGGVLVHTQLLHQVIHPLRAEQAHNVVLQGEVEPGLARVTLTAGTAPQLVVDAAGFVALGAQDEQTARRPDPVGLLLDFCLVFGLRLGKLLPGVQNLLVVRLGKAGGFSDELIGHPRLAQVGLGQELGVAPQHNVGTAAGHVGGHGDRPELTRLGHDLRFLLVVLGVEDVVLDPFALENGGQLLRFLDGHGAHQHRLALGVAGLDLLHNGPKLAGDIFIHHVGLVDTGQGLVGGNLHDVQLVDGAELLLLGEGGTRHAGQLVVETEVVLEGDGCQGFGLIGHLHVLLGLDGLVQALVVTPTEHQAAGELVHNDNLAVLHHIVDVPLHHTTGLDGLVDVVGQGSVLHVRQVVHLEGFLRLFDAPGCKRGGLGLLIHDVVGVDVHVLFLFLVHLPHPLALQPGDELVHNGVQLGGLLPLAGDNQGGAGLVDEDGVHLVHDSEGVAPLDQLLGVDSHVVPEVVEAKFVVGAVGDVGLIGGLFLLAHDPVDHQTHCEPHEAEDLAHPLRVTLGQVVVDGDNVDPLARQGIEVGGEGGHQGLALAGLHLGDTALVEHHAAHQLHPVGPQAQHTPGRLPHGGEGLRQQVVQGLALLQAGLELRRLGGELGVRHGLEVRLQGLDPFHNGVDLLELPLTVGAEKFRN